MTYIKVVMLNNFVVYRLNSIDYRLLNSMGMDSFYSPLGPSTDAKIQQVWDQLTGSSEGSYQQV